MTITLISCDVSTHWNSTFDMLQYAFNHQKAVDTITQSRELGLRKFKLADHEWEVLEQLCSMLKAFLTVVALQPY